MTTRRPILHARLDTGDTVDDPSEDALFLLLADIDTQDALWIIVEKAGTDEVYAQCIRLEDGSYQVERRLGDESTHETVQVADMRTAHERLTSWAFAL
jgi:hypothetical protein